MSERPTFANQVNYSRIGVPPLVIDPHLYIILEEAGWNMKPYIKTVEVPTNG
jgi:hypothetical protein